MRWAEAVRAQGEGEPDFFVGLQPLSLFGRSPPANLQRKSTLATTRV